MDTLIERIVSEVESGSFEYASFGDSLNFSNEDSEDSDMGVSMSVVIEVDHETKRFAFSPPETEYNLISSTVSYCSIYEEEKEEERELTREERESLNTAIYSLIEKEIKSWND